jgi:hypothetical protein
MSCFDSCPPCPGCEALRGQLAEVERERDSAESGRIQAETRESAERESWQARCRMILELKIAANERADAALARTAALEEALREALSLAGGWREAITELEDFCSESVRLKNMTAAAEQLDNWVKRARALLPRTPSVEPAR